MQRRLNAWLLARADDYMHRKYGARKRAIFDRLPRQVVEIGAGTGANLRYYRPGTHLTAVEPNPAMHPALRRHAARFKLDLTIEGRKGESLDLASDSQGAVVGTLVLCSVDDPRQVVAEIRRILAPGGRFIFLEHVAALPGTPLSALQQLLRRPWQWLFDGCRLNRETHRILWEAGFSSLDMDCFMLASPALAVMPHIFGVAVK
jgi:SAM-dependent methyltransferase